MAKKLRHKKTGRFLKGKTSHKRIRVTCTHCGKIHKKGVHRFHGYGSFKKTHG